MMVLSVALMAVALLTDDEVRRDVAEREAAVAHAGKAALTDDESEKQEYASISSRTCDADRARGVIMFEGDVKVEYNVDTVLGTDRLFVFLNSSNRLSRIVALGNVSLTNGVRRGRSEMATFVKRTGRIDMYGGENGSLAKLQEGTDILEGTHIRFWMNSEVVEVDNTRISVQQKGEGVER
jgi:hypothetical protein